MFGNTWAVRDGDIKLVIGNQEVRAPELFVLVAGPTESNDLIANMRGKVKELREKWDPWNKGNMKPTWVKIGELPRAAGD